MIYLVGTVQDAQEWGVDNDFRVLRNPSVRLITTLEKALAHRPAQHDRIILLRHGDTEAAARLRDAQKFGAPGG